MLGAIILAAGQGKRLNCINENKVLLKLCGKTLIGYTCELLKKLNIEKIVVVVGFAKESVMECLKGTVSYAIQEKAEGTGNAALVGLSQLSPEVDKVLVMYGDHSFFYTPDMVRGLLDFQETHKFQAVLITVERKDPYNYGRIIRSGENTLSAIVEEKNANEEQKKIKEINPGFYLFKKSFLKKYLPLIKRNPVSNEFYLTDVVEIAVRDGVEVGAYKVNNENISVGVNTQEQLQEAEELMKKNHAK